jgi:hypothetical protein
MQRAPLTVALTLVLTGVACSRTDSPRQTASGTTSAALTASTPGAGAPSTAPAPPSAKRAGPPAFHAERGGTGFPCAVDQALALTCRRCHWDPPEHDAPFALVDWKDVQSKREGKPIFQLMIQMLEADLMPPPDVSLDPPVHPMPAEQKATLLAWLKAGAIRSEVACPK